MLYSDEDIIRRLRLGEDSGWEFRQVEFSGNRPSEPSRSQWADEIAAFANAKGGMLLCGVTDDGEVQGMSREQIVALDAFLVEVSATSIRPSVRINIEHKELPSGKFLLVEIPEGDAQHDSPGGSYIRVGGNEAKDDRRRADALGATTRPGAFPLV